MKKRKGLFKFHGAFSKKADAMKKEKAVGGFIKKVSIRGKTRYSVMTSK